MEEFLNIHISVQKHTDFLYRLIKRYLFSVFHFVCFYSMAERDLQRIVLHNLCHRRIFQYAVNVNELCVKALLGLC